MTILVTGSAGTIGAQVLAHLQGRNVDVRALTRSPEAYAAFAKDATARWARG
jgi:uncharacterized protein YbjT (DUF2867 family)